MSVVERTSVLADGLERDQLIILLLLSPFAIFFAILWIIPIGYTFLASLFSNPLNEPVFVNIENYVNIIASDWFWQYLWNGIVFAVSTTVFSLIVGLMFALVVNRVLFAGGALRTLMIFPYLIPTVAVVFLWRFLLDQNVGLVNRLLIEFGVIQSPIAFFADPALAMPSVIVTSVWKWGSFAFFILLANLQTIPDEYYERATVQGASVWQQFRDITLPHLTSAILLIMFVRGIWMFNKYDVIWLTTRGGPAGATTTLPIQVYDLAISQGMFGAGTALAVIMFLLLSIVGVGYFKYLDPAEEVTN